MRHIPSRCAFALLTQRRFAHLPWAGATWAVDGQGRAYNTPTLGAQLFANPGFDSDTSWTKGTGWSIAAGVASHAAGTASNLSQAGLLTVGGWYQFTFTVSPLTAGSVQPFLFTALSPPATAGGEKLFTGRAIGGTLSGITCNAAFAGDLDDIDLRRITLSDAVATIDYGISTPVGRLQSIVAGTQSGVVANWDGSDGLFAYHDGIGVIFDKVVGGTWTNLIARVTTPFVAGAQIEIRRSGDVRQVFYNGAKIGGDITVSDADINAATRYGLFSTYSGNLFTEFTLDGFVVPFGLPGL